MHVLPPLSFVADKVDMSVTKLSGLLLSSAVSGIDNVAVIGEYVS